MTPMILATIAENFTQSLFILVQGMAGVFVFMGLFYAVIFVLERMFKEKKKE